MCSKAAICQIRSHCFCWVINIKEKLVEITILSLRWPQFFLIQNFFISEHSKTFLSNHRRRHSKWNNSKLVIDLVSKATNLIVQKNGKGCCKTNLTFHIFIFIISQLESIGSSKSLCLPHNTGYANPAIWTVHMFCTSGKL